MRLVAAITQPVKLRTFPNRVCCEFEQFAVAEITKLGRTARIVTLRNHGQSCAMLMLEEWMPCSETIDALHKFRAESGVLGDEELR